MNQEQFDLHALVSTLLSSGQRPTRLELATMRQYVSRRGFDPEASTRAGGRLSGLSWNGRSISGSDLLSVKEAHFLRHVIVGREWPQGTTVSDYLASLTTAILDMDGPVLLDIKLSVPRLTFFSRTTEQLPLRRDDWTLVGFDVHYGYWTTGFRTVVTPEAYRRQLPSALRRWLHQPT
jgi:hypothetical protein